MCIIRCWQNILLYSPAFRWAVFTGWTLTLVYDELRISYVVLVTFRHIHPADERSCKSWVQLLKKYLTCLKQLKNTYWATGRLKYVSSFYFQSFAVYRPCQEEKITSTKWVLKQQNCILPRREQNQASCCPKVARVKVKTVFFSKMRKFHPFENQTPSSINDRVNWSV